MLPSTASPGIPGSRPKDVEPSPLQTLELQAPAKESPTSGRGRPIRLPVQSATGGRRYTAGWGFLRRERNCLRNLATLGATTAWQYGWVGLWRKYS